MVPPDATDIRDTRDAGFNRIETLAFRAGVLEIVAVTLVALGGLMVILALVGIARRTQRAKGPVERLIGRPALLRLAARELSAAQRESAEQGWNESLVTRAVSALRISAAGALGRPVSQRLVDPTAEQGQGRFLIKRVGRDQRMAVSSSVTGEDVDPRAGAASGDRRAVPTPAARGPRRPRWARCLPRSTAGRRPTAPRSTSPSPRPSKLPGACNPSTPGRASGCGGSARASPCCSARRDWPEPHPHADRPGHCRVAQRPSRRSAVLASQRSAAGAASPFWP